jgi:hypothetical protein
MRWSDVRPGDIVIYSMSYVDHSLWTVLAIDKQCRVTFLRTCNGMYKVHPADETSIGDAVVADGLRVYRDGSRIF